jgi:LacI family transcriptional regulator
MKIRVTQSDVARVAGVHNTTVSLALRNSRLIPESTRQRIQAIAQSMGYSPDPALRALVAYRNSRRERREAETLAYVTNWDTKWGWRNLPAHERYYAAAQRRAAELGYQIEHFWLGETGMSQRRLDRMFLHRGISGMLLASHRTSSDELSTLNWSRLSAVKIGCLPQMPALNQVTVDPGSIMRLALRHARGEGYQRIGLVLPNQWDEQSDHAWSTAFHAEQYRHAVKQPLPILYLQDSPETADLTGGRTGGPAGDTHTLARWHRQHRPDLVIGLAPEVLGHIRCCGLRVPADLAYMDLFLGDSGYSVAGVWENCEKIGELAVELVVNQLERNALGLPDVPTVTSIGGVWRDGASMPTQLLPGVEALEPAVPVALPRNLVA